MCVCVHQTPCNKSWQKRRKDESTPTSLPCIHPSNNNQKVSISKNISAAKAKSCCLDIHSHSDKRQENEEKSNKKIHKRVYTRRHPHFFCCFSSCLDQSIPCLARCHRKWNTGAWKGRTDPQSLFFQNQTNEKQNNKMMMKKGCVSACLAFTFLFSFTTNNKNLFSFFFLLLLFSPCSSVPSLRRWSPLASSESACAWACFCGWIVPYLFFSFLLLPFVFCLGILFTKTEQPTFLLFFSFLPPLLSSPVPFGSVLLGLGFPDRSTHTHDFIFSLSHSLSRSLFCTSTSTSMEKKIRRWKKRSKVKA